MKVQLIEDPNEIIERIDQLLEVENSELKYKWSKQAWLDFVSKNQFVCSVHENGFALCAISSADKLIHLLKIAVRVQYQGSGLAGQLFDCINAKYLDFRWYLEVESSNTKAIKFYENKGFQRLYEKRSYYSDGADALIMERSTCK